MYLQIVYCSAATAPFSAADLDRLLIGSRSKNERLGITGFLLYDAGSFLQVIEGRAAETEALFDTIRHDLRHCHVKVLVSKNVPEREFGEWSMAFAAAQGHEDGLEGFLDYDSTREEFTADASQAAQILALFQQGLLRPAEARDSDVGTVSITIRPQHGDALGHATPRQRNYLLDFGRALAMTVPDVQVGVQVGGGDPINFNLRRDLQKGEVELF